VDSKIALNKAVLVTRNKAVFITFHDYRPTKQPDNHDYLVVIREFSKNWVAPSSRNGYEAIRTQRRITKISRKMHNTMSMPIHQFSQTASVYAIKNDRASTLIKSLDLNQQSLLPWEY
jgi:aspartate/methionine/tyrosine aminotransferase